MQIPQKEKWTLTLSSGLMLFIVLYVYKAYDIQQGVSLSGHSLLFRAIIFGLGASAGFYFLEFFVLSKFSLQNIKQLLFWRIGEIFFVMNIAFLLFNYFWNWTEFSFYAYFLMLFEMYMVMLIPVILSWLVGMSARQKNILWKFVSENGKETLTILPENLLFIQSAENYVEIHYQSGDSVKKSLLRNTLKSLESYESQGLVR